MDLIGLIQIEGHFYLYTDLEHNSYIQRDPHLLKIMVKDEIAQSIEQLNASITLVKTELIKASEEIQM